MAFITSKLSAPVTYAFYKQTEGKINVVVDEIKLNGGADVINKALVTPQGVVTELDDERLEKLKSHPVFQTHLNNGYVSIQSSEKAAQKAEETLEKDKSSQITPDDYEKGDEKKQIRPKRKPSTKK